MSIFSQVGSGNEHTYGLSPAGGSSSTDLYNNGLLCLELRRGFDALVKKVHAFRLHALERRHSASRALLVHYTPDRELKSLKYHLPPRDQSHIQYLSQILPKNHVDRGCLNTYLLP